MVSGSPLVLGHGVDGGFEGDGGEIRCGNHKKKSQDLEQKRRCVASSAGKIDLPEKQKSKRQKKFAGGNTNKQKLKLKEVTRLHKV